VGLKSLKSLNLTNVYPNNNKNNKNNKKNNNNNNNNNNKVKSKPLELRSRVKKTSDPGGRVQQFGRHMKQKVVIGVVAWKKVGRGRSHNIFSLNDFMNLHALGYPKPVTIFWFIGFVFNQRQETLDLPYLTLLCDNLKNRIFLQNFFS
jgi:hypothetical protein